MSRPTARHLLTRRGLLVVWSGWLVGPGAWALHENLSFVLVRWVCRSDNPWALHLTTLVALALVVAVGALSWRSFAVLRAQDDAAPGRRRSRCFLALGGLILCALAAGGILVEGIPNLLLDPCAEAA